MWRKFSIKILALSSIVISFVIGFNWFIDPFDIFDSPAIPHLNSIKTETEHRDRIFKERNLIRIKPLLCVLGNSSADIGIDPQNVNFGGIRGFNAAMNSMTPTEYEYILNTAIGNGCRNFIISTDYRNFGETFLTKDTFDKEALGKSVPIKYYISYDALQSSVETVIRNISGSSLDIYLKNGQHNFMYMLKGTEKGEGYKKSFRTSEAAYYHFYLHLDLQDQHWQAWERVLNKAYKEGVKVTLFISPCHARHLEILSLSQGWSKFEEFKKRLIATNERIAFQNGKKPFVLWDFTGYNKFTTEIVPDDPGAKMKWYWDSMHYKKELGDILLDRIFDGNFSGGQNYADFGVKLTSQNIEAHLVLLRAQREEWESSHPQDVSEIAALSNNQIRY
ncbi:MAG: hypothetical protein HQL14_03995 [Candidatus Omnitrophica bacterium]|nr:hypothetical protein [Candidatus Omnitrophota bacterium]